LVDILIFEIFTSLLDSSFDKHLPDAGLGLVPPFILVLYSFWKTSKVRPEGFRASCPSWDNRRLVCAGCNQR